ncbi:hypothetical protein SAMN05428945_0167 [Streptomyces sp. 2224.1]|nr:hypothetical protein SAMN05428945_0167 [Streptomyces sp. 2224.1]
MRMVGCWAVCPWLAPVRPVVVGGGPEGTPGTPSSARAHLVRGIDRPGVRSSPAGGAPGIPSDLRASATVPPYRSPLRPQMLVPWQGAGRRTSFSGPAVVIRGRAHSGRGLPEPTRGSVRNGATGPQSGTGVGRRGCTGARPQDRSERRAILCHVAAAPAPWGHLPAEGWGRAAVRPLRPPRQPHKPPEGEPHTAAPNNGRHNDGAPKGRGELRAQPQRPRRQTRDPAPRGAPRRQNQRSVIAAS